LLTNIKSKKMKFKFIIILFIIIFAGCKNKPKNLLPRENFINMLAEVHLYDAIMSKESFFDKNILITDSASFYNQLFVKYNITRQDFTDNINFYSANLDDFDDIYIDVLAILNKKLSDLDSLENIEGSEQAEIVDSTNLWNLKDSWILPADGDNEPIKFTVEVTKSGTYTLSAEIKMFEDDKTVEQRMSIFAYYEDGSFDSNSNGTIAKDGTFNKHEVSITTNASKQLKYLTGWVLDHSEGTEKKHSEVKNIRLEYVILD